MRVSTEEFLKKFKELYLIRAPYIATLAYWKMKRLIEEGETFYLPEFDCIYMIRDNHLLIYYAPDGKMHIDMDVLNALDCVSLPAKLYDSVKDRLKGFNDSRSWGLRYDFDYEPPQRVGVLYETVDFDFENQNHYDKAAEIICGDGDWMKAKNVKRMTDYSAFDPSLWFFVKEIASQELIAVSISQYSEEARQTDLDWIFVSPRYQGKGAGRYLIERTIERCKHKSDDICVGGTVEFYKKCGFYEYELWVWASKGNYRFTAPSIQP